ncbi:lantibiotic dehydratase [Streptomyces sp. NPDC089799]|uniref:lantibiotic dehydratase n=1 Tax=Streptomyces sp. NPDC089799 TaxID=3155066 RepID=UPI003421ED69
MRRFVVADTAATRVNLLPYAPLVRPQTAAAWDRLAAAADRALVTARLADGALAESAGSAGAPAWHLRVRRRIREKPLTPLPAAAPGGDAATVPAVADWQAAADAYRTLLEQVAHDRAAAAAHERHALSLLCAEEELASSVELISPHLGAAVRRYADSGGEATRADRKSEPRITAYALRAMTRTSPRSRFTAVALSAAQDGPAAGPGAPAAARWATAPPTVALRTVEVQRGALLSALEPAPRPGLPVRLAPLLPAAPGELAFMAITPAHPRPRKVTLRRAPELTELTAVARFGVHAWEDVAGRLAEALDCPASRAEQVMRAALRAGLLGSALPVDDQDPNFLTACHDALPEVMVGETGAEVEPGALALVDGAGHGGLRAVVAELAGATALLAADTVAARPALHARFRAAASRLPHADALAPQLYEDAVAVLPPLPGSEASPAAAAAALLPVLGAFDLKADLRIGLRAAVRARGGTVRLVAEAENLAADAARLATSAAAGDTGAPLDPDSRAAMVGLWTFRRRVLADLADLFEAALAAGDGVDAVIEDEHLAAWAAALPEQLHADGSSYALMAQYADGRWAANGWFGGYGATSSRFLEADSAAGGAATAGLRARLRRVLGPAVAEDRAAHGFNTGCHPPLLDREMTARDWAGTVLVDEGPAGRLRLRTPRGLRPITVGSTRWDLMPAPSRIALWLQGGGVIACAYDHVFRERARPGAGVIAVPRLRHGNLVLQRRRWYLPDAEVLTGTCRGSVDDLHRLVRLRAEHGVPARFFVKQLPEWERGEALVPDVTSRPVSQPKPRYVDTAGVLGLASFAKDAADFTHPYLEECLPGPAAGHHVREAVYEFDLAEAESTRADAASATASAAASSGSESGSGSGRSAGPGTPAGHEEGSAC